MDTFHLLPYDPSWDERWDRFVMEGSANGTFLQTRRFLGYHPSGRFEDASLMALDGQELVAVCPAAAQTVDGVRMLRSHPGSTFGGLVIAPALLRAPRLVTLVSIRISIGGSRASARPSLSSPATCSALYPPTRCNTPSTTRATRTNWRSPPMCPSRVARMRSWWPPTASTSATTSKSASRPGFPTAPCIRGESWQRFYGPAVPEPEKI